MNPEVVAGTKVSSIAGLFNCRRVVVMKKVVLWVTLCLLVSLVSAEFAAAFNTKRVMAVIGANNNREYDKALRLIDEQIEELKDSKLPEDKDMVKNFHVLAISNLGRKADFKGLEPGMDEAALHHYKAVLKYAPGDPALKADTNRVLISYYSNTGRNGLALTYKRENLAYWKAINNTYQVFLGLDGFAATYGDMGQHELADNYSSQAMAIARDYFVLGERPDSRDEWRNYNEILRKRMDGLARPGQAEKVLAVWETMEPLVRYYRFDLCSSYAVMAEYMGICGDFEQASDFLAKAYEIDEQDKKYDHSGDLICRQSSLSMRAGDYKAARKDTEKCLSGFEKMGQDPGHVAFRHAGFIFEQLGELDRAIGYYRRSISEIEGTRSSFDVVHRATFFRGNTRDAYCGLIRCLLKKFERTGAADDFMAAVLATELVRGRQFGELIDENDKDAVTRTSLLDLRAGLGSDQIILAYLMTDENIILFAITKDRQAGFLLPHESIVFRNRVMTIADGLANPDSDMAAIRQQLQEVSRIVLEPVKAMLPGKRHVIVLPDGVLNAIPFDLLTTDIKAYKPLILTRLVQAAPSFKFLIHARKSPVSASSGLFALADPVYSQTRAIGGIESGEIRSLTRGSQYLSYFEPLPETRTEVEGIASMFKDVPVQTLYGREAVESTFKSTDLSGFRFLHMATHGILGNDVPGIAEPALVMADEAGEDGFLTASEAQALKLNADLSVLSACNTGTGKYFTGEGVMGMSRAFLLAGSRSVLVSLWSVPSIETEQLMLSFYKHLRAGEPIPAAIRKAKLGMMGISPAGKVAAAEMVHPFFWSAFIPFGAL